MLLLCPMRDQYQHNNIVSITSEWWLNIIPWVTIADNLALLFFWTIICKVLSQSIVWTSVILIKQEYVYVDSTWIFEQDFASWWLSTFTFPKLHVGYGHLYNAADRICWFRNTLLIPDGQFCYKFVCSRLWHELVSLKYVHWLWIYLWS